MKRLIYTTVFCLFLAFSATGQAKYDLEFSTTSFKLTSSQSSDVALDTVYVGQTYYIKGNITNNGPDDYPGGKISLNIRLDEFESTTNPDDVREVTLPGIQAQNTLFNYLYGTILITKDIADVEKENIIITWPNDFQDENDNNNLNKTEVFVTEGGGNSGTSIADPAKASFQLFPNPAQEFVNVQLTKAVNGMVTLTDITGKRLYEVNLRSADNMVTIPLHMDGENLSEGVYFINVTTSEGREVQKLILAK